MVCITMILPKTIMKMHIYCLNEKAKQMFGFDFRVSGYNLGEIKSALNDARTLEE